MSTLSKGKKFTAIFLAKESSQAIGHLLKSRDFNSESSYSDRLYKVKKILDKLSNSKEYESFAKAMKEKRAFISNARRIGALCPHCSRPFDSINSMNRHIKAKEGSCKKPGSYYKRHMKKKGLL